MTNHVSELNLDAAAHSLSSVSTAAGEPSVVYAHLALPYQTDAAAPDGKRVELIKRGFVIEHPAYTQAMANAHWILTMPKGTPGRGLLLTGNPGSGKSTFGEELARAYDEKVVVVSAEGSRTIREFYGRVLASLSGPAVHPGSTTDREMAVLRVIKALGIKALVVDEIQDLAKGTDRELNRVLAGIKFLTNKARLPLICMGALDSKSAFRTDEHLAQRLRPYSLPKWKVDQQFADFIGNLEAMLPLRRPSSLRNEDALTYLITCSNGSLRAIMERVALAAVHAILTGEECLTLKGLEAAEFAPSMEKLRKLKYA